MKQDYKLLVLYLVMLAAVVATAFGYGKSFIGYWFGEPAKPAVPAPTKKPVKGKLKYEEECRRVLESVYNKPFPKKRPSFLRNPETNRALELDGFNEDLKIAFEYDGSHHRHYNPHFHRNREGFAAQQRRDKFKREKCVQLDIYVITIPHTVPFEKLETFIRHKLISDKRIIGQINSEEENLVKEFEKLSFE